MSIIYILIPIAIIFTALAIYLFFWAVKSDQFEDLEKQGLSILFEDDKEPKKNRIDNDIVTSNGKHNSTQHK
jgi:cbb3-type cytochrome oxidase maturation protein